MFHYKVLRKKWKPEIIIKAKLWQVLVLLRVIIFLNKTLSRNFNLMLAVIDRGVVSLAAEVQRHEAGQRARAWCRERTFNPADSGWRECSPCTSRPSRAVPSPARRRNRLFCQVEQEQQSPPRPGRLVAPRAGARSWAAHLLFSQKAQTLNVYRGLGEVELGTKTLTLQGRKNQLLQ